MKFGKKFSKEWLVVANRTTDDLVWLYNPKWPGVALVVYRDSVVLRRRIMNPGAKATKGSWHGKNSVILTLPKPTKAGDWNRLADSIRGFLPGLVRSGRKRSWNGEMRTGVKRNSIGRGKHFRGLPPRDDIYQIIFK